MGSAVLDGLLKKQDVQARNRNEKDQSGDQTRPHKITKNHSVGNAYRNVGANSAWIRMHTSLIPNNRKSETHGMTKQKQHK